MVRSSFLRQRPLLISLPIRRQVLMEHLALDKARGYSDRRPHLFPLHALEGTSRLAARHVRARDLQGPVSRDLEPVLVSSRGT